MSNEGEAGRWDLVAVVGPTAVGKSEAALRLCERLGGEIVSADSMQVYRGMDIGTAKPTPEEQARVRHHLIDIRSPDEPFSVAEYSELALEAVQDIRRRGKISFLVGGTGFYVEAVTHRPDFPPAPPDEGFRRAMEAEAEAHGNAALHERLRQVDPETAARLHLNDRKRVIRALEIWAATGRPRSGFKGREGASPRFERQTVFGLTMRRELLYERIDRRVEAMMAQGFEAEVRALRASGYDRRCAPMRSLGYNELMEALESGSDPEAAVALIQRNTRRYAKRQLVWFRARPEIVWVDMSEEMAGRVQWMAHFLTGGNP
ncbi:MAG: tRNA (adenosine(37)-N6)-dimethylallyltransferase MiaA [Armatimonadetes bacterium]|nr:tRNA (adenosine(37)-N6)-dimethylallyltransferase MiaA [Armatimonadota bacterium]